LLTSEKESPPGTPANPIEKWHVGYWMRRPTELAPTIERLLANPAELARLRANTRALARRHAAREAMLKGWQARR
jgi:UDP-N-acetylglucosamine:LPS N-acetylglucosamine transferase